MNAKVPLHTVILEFLLSVHTHICSVITYYPCFTTPHPPKKKKKKKKIISPPGGETILSFKSDLKLILFVPWTNLDGKEKLLYIGGCMLYQN